MSQHPDFAVFEGLAGPGQAQLRLLDPAGLNEIEEARWDDLGQHRAGNNVFAEPWLMRLSLMHCDPQRRAVLAVVANADGTWLGAMPLVRALRHGRAFWPNWSGWSHPNQFNGLPLVRLGHEARFWRALLSGLDALPGPVLSLCLSDLPSDDPVGRALLRVCREQGRAWQAHRTYHRASLRADEGLAARLGTLVKPKLRRRLESLERQLAEDHGAVTYHSTCDPERIAALVETFLSLEASGWKGAAGSALSQCPTTEGFFREAAKAAAARGRFEVSWLETGGEYVAMTTQFVGAANSCGFKRAHAEQYARYAPGQLHLKHLTRQLVAEARNFDSSASPCQESLNRMWPDRSALSDVRVAIGGGGKRALHRLLCGVQGVWHRLKPPPR